MALVKRTYTSGTTITSENLNAIQDAIIDNEAGITNLQASIGNLDGVAVKTIAQTLTTAGKAQARTNLGIVNTVKAGSSIATGDKIALGEVYFVVTGTL